MPRLSRPTGLSPAITAPASRASPQTPNSSQLTRVAKQAASISSIQFSPSPATAKNLNYQSTSSTTAEPSFICTICWQPQLAPSKPKLLGTSSRIVCRPCWKAVLNLSICWVCGECIVRGDQVVSLGWCFWHRACFGCLTCGSKMDLEDFAEEESLGWGQWDNVGKDGTGEGMVLGKRKRLVGVELESVPLCESCDVETAGKSYKKVVKKGLETISRFDGGLTRDRLHMLSEEKEETNKVSRSKWKRSKFRGSSGLERELKRFINGSTSRWSDFAATDDLDVQKALLKHAAEMGVSEDENLEEEISPTNSGAPRSPEESIVYVSVIDPLREPAFKPSKTKPLPKWMSFLPNNVNRERKRRRQEAISEPGAQSHGMTRLSERTTSTHARYTSENDQDTPVLLSNDSATRTEFMYLAPPVARPTSAEKSRTSKRSHSTSNNETRVATHGRMSQQLKFMETTSDTFSPTSPTGPKTPKPNYQRPSIARRETTSYFSHGFPKFYIPEAELSYRQLGDGPHSSQPSPNSSPEDTTSINFSIGYMGLQSESPSPHLAVNSSEYLDRYKPISAKASYQKYVAKEPEPILEKIRRQRVYQQSQSRPAVETGEETRGSSRVRNAEDGELTPESMRKDLNKELRSLFCQD